MQLTRSVIISLESRSNIFVQPVHRSSAFPLKRLSERIQRSFLVLLPLTFSLGDAAITHSSRLESSPHTLQMLQSSISHSFRRPSRTSVEAGGAQPQQ